MISARSSHRSINLLARCDNAPGKHRQVPGDACCCLLVLPAAVCSVHTGPGAPCDWQAKMRRCLLEIDWQQHGQLWLCLVVVSRCCCSSLLLLVVVVAVLHQCCNEQCLHYKAQCVNAMHACACPDRVQTPQTPRQTDRARTHAATHARNEGGEGAETTAI